MEVVKPKTVDPFCESKAQGSPRDSDTRDNKIQSATKFSYTFSTQPLETDLKKLLSQVTGKNDLASITEVRLKVVSGHAGLHRLSDFTPHLRILTLDGSCIASFRDLGSSLKSLTMLSVARCNMRHLDGVSGFRSLEELNAKENFVSDPSPCASVKKLLKLDLSGNQVSDVTYFAFLRSCRKLKELHVSGNQFSEYKEEIKTLLPQLRILDGEEFEDIDYLEQGTVLQECEDLSSEDEGTPYLSTQPVGNIHLGEMKAAQGEDEKDTKGQEEEKEEEEEEEEEEGGGRGVENSRTESHPHANDSETPNNNDKSTSREKPSGKLSSGRSICGNLAVSLRARNSTTRLSLSAIQAQIKDADLGFREEEKMAIDQRSEQVELGKTKDWNY